MANNKFKALITSAFLVIAICCTQVQKTQNTSNNTTNVNQNASTPAASDACPASADWVANPQNAPSEIPGGGATLCQFHQFSWQWFLAMMSQTGDHRVFQDQANFPLLLAGDNNSCTATGVKSRVFVRTKKNNNGPQDDFIMPERIDQAGFNQATVYDQNGNVVYYEVRFSRSECNLAPTAKAFEPGTTELKISYRVITEADKPNYVWINADINGDGKTDPNELLGMVGFHLAKSTASHPEFIWATFEHKQNVPECQSPASPDAKAWSFTSAKCAVTLPNSVDPKICNFNAASTNVVLSGGPPTEVCRVYHDASMKGDNQYDSNVADIDMLNNQLVGANGFITVLSDANALSVLKNYQLVGALWVTDINQPSNLPNQRGSIQLANTTMETTFQQAKLIDVPQPSGTPQPEESPIPYTGTSNLQPAANCFACHQYTTADNNTKLSHIFDSILGKSKKQ
jgi:hypothetical protein